MPPLTTEKAPTPVPWIAPTYWKRLNVVPVAPTAAPGTNTTQVATTAFVIAVRDALLASAPGALDTLNVDMLCKQSLFNCLFTQAVDDG